tara:strand:- start:455 stop:748 length:294 start_codon:yes stop_codon:yes gene_type:complete
MKAYLVGFFKISDPKKYYSDYVEPVLKIIAKHGGHPLIVSDQCLNKEGHLPEGRFVVIEFPDMKTAETFYNDPEYLPYKPVRQALTHSTLAFVEGTA